MIWTTIHPFLCPDKTHIEPILRHLRSARVGRLVLTVPWGATQSRLSTPPNLEPVQEWVQQARRLGVPVVLHVGPVFMEGWPSWGWPEEVWAFSPQEQKEAVLAWWRVLRTQLDPSTVLLSFGNVVDRAFKKELRAFWSSVAVEEVEGWSLLDVRDIEWGEWEFDTAWWTQVDRWSPGNSVRVWAWWLGQKHSHRSLPTAETVHEALDGPFVRTLMISLWARGVSRVWWDPVKGGVFPGIAPPPPWGTTLDGGAPFRAWGASTSTWFALKRLMLQAYVLRVAEMTWSSEGPGEVQGDVEVLGWGHGDFGSVLALRRLTPGETTVVLQGADGSGCVEARWSGPDAWLLPVQWSILDGLGRVEIATGDVLWRQSDDEHEMWVLDGSKGAEWILCFAGEVMYETGATLSHPSDTLWHVSFDAGQPGQVVWQVGGRRFHLVAVDEVMADTLWPPEADHPYLMLGPSQILHVSGTSAALDLRVTTERPVGFLVAHHRPLHIEVVENKKTSVWGRRAGMGGVRLGGPKEWGAPRVTLPELKWESLPWDGPMRPGMWEEVAAGVHLLKAGWYWFQCMMPPSLPEVTLTIQGVGDVWLGDVRVSGMRSVDRPRTRTFRLPERAHPMPLTLVVWVPALPPETAAGHAGSVTLPHMGTEVGPWRSRQGVCGVDGSTFTLHPTAICGVSESAAAFWLHRTRFHLDLPEGVWVRLGIPLGDVGEWVWVFLNGVLIGQWWSGWSRELALWLPPDVLRTHGANEMAFLHWPRGREKDLPPLFLQQLHRERVWHVRITS